MTGSSPDIDVVRAALQRAISERVSVTVVVRGDPEAGRAARVIEGTPVNLELSRQGAERVTIAVDASDTMQKILLDRIDRVLPGHVGS